MYFDVVVIGSGPAGCAAAICCTQQGLHTLVITCNTAKAEAGNTVPQPSESVHPGIVSILSQLNAAHCIDIASRGIYEGIEVNKQYNALGEDANGAWHGHNINRALFDDALLQTAVKQGVTIQENDSVAEIVTTGDRVSAVTTNRGIKVSCRYVVDASGHKRVAGRQLRFKESFFSPPLVAWTGICEGIEAGSFLFERRYARFIPHANGWTWLAPEYPGRCTWTRLEVKGKQQFLPPPALEAYPFASLIKTSNRRWRVFRPVCKEGVLLCGDAAGIIDPAAGQGVLNAMVSGMMAAKTVKACIANPAFEAVYLAKYDDWFISDYREKVNKLKYFYELHGIKIF